ncbi:IclR family transcriptional regulator [Psychrobacillus sp. NPDC096389]|uniref:IclR family transcriptional regulator n=1 Tax=Psychrobacillus sp. NPDC096389 TaxID=3364490 RepID=UPI003818E620
MDTSNNKTQRLTTLDSAIDVLLALDSENSKSIRELGQELDVSKSTLHRILQTFENRGLIKQDLNTMKYSLGLMILELGKGLKETNELRKIAYPLMEQLRDETGETIQLAIQEEDKIVILENIDGTNLYRLFSQSGMTFPLTYGNFGKIFLSRMDTKEILSIMEKHPLKKYSPQSIIDPELFLKKISEVKNAGICIGVDDPTEGAYSIICPIVNHRGETVAAISVAGVKTSIALENIKETEQLIRKTALSISRKIGYSLS